MKFPFYLAARNLLRRPARNLLYILGISITAALLLDMMLLSGGIRSSLGRILDQMGYEIRVCPRGTLPFETNAQISGFRELRTQMERLPGLRYTDAILGGNVQLEHAGRKYPSLLLGLLEHRRVLYRVVSGTDALPGRNEVLVNRYLARDKHIGPGDSIVLSVGNQEQAIGATALYTVSVAGIADYVLDAEGQYSISCPLPLAQQILGQKDAVSLIMLKLQDPGQAESLREQIDRSFPRVSAYTIASVLRAVDRQLSYFKQFAYILGGISMVTCFVLVFIITTLSFHDRLGEIALLKAIGLSSETIFRMIIIEGLLVSITSAACGAVLGKFVALYLDSILKSAPGLPENFSFFVMEPGAIIRGLLILVGTGVFAGLYPAASAVRLPVAETLREEIL